MALDWESHRSILEELYLKQDMTLKEVSIYMKKERKFEASKAQYEKTFKTWNLRKNLTQNDWQYIHHRIKKRKESGKESAVNFKGMLMSAEKVKKELSRNIRASSEIMCLSISSPQSPGGISIYTPPGITEEYNIDTMNSNTIGCISPDVSYDKDLETINNTYVLGSHKFDNPSSNLNTFYEMTLDIDNLPCFQFQDLISQQTILDYHIQEPLLFDYFGSIPLFQAPPFMSIIPYDEDYKTFIPLSSNTKDGASTLQKALRLILIETGYKPQLDALDYLLHISSELTRLLATMMERKDGELQSRCESLLAPPDLQSTHLFIETAIILSSNHILTDRINDSFLEWLLKNIPWSSLRLLVLQKVPTIQAFMQRLFLFSIRRNYPSITEDLLENDAGIRDIVQTSGLFLVEAVAADNSRIADTLLRVGANVNMPEWQEGKFKSNRQPLHVVRSVKLAKRLIEANAHINTVVYSLSHPFYYSPLVRAVARGDTEIVRCLINSGADVNLKACWHGYTKRCSYPVTALRLAIDQSHTEIVDMLLKAGADVHQPVIQGPRGFSAEFYSYSTLNTDWRIATPLQAAVSVGSIEIVELLIEAGSDINARAYGRTGKTALQEAIQNQHPAIADLLIKKGAKVNMTVNSCLTFLKTPLLAAVELNDTLTATLLLNAGADVNSRAFGEVGSTVLETAKAQANSTKMVSILLAHGAIEDIPTNNPHRQIELREAVRKGNFGVVKYLVSLGVTIDMEKLGRKRGLAKTILHWFLDSKPYNLEIFEFLVQRIANVNEQNNNIDVRPILEEVIIKDGTVEMVQLLLDARLEVNTKSPMGTPLQLAARRGKADIVSLLLSQGANVNATASGYHKETALQASLCYYKFSADIFWNLINHGADINAHAGVIYGSTVLQKAVQKAVSRDQVFDNNFDYITLIRQLLALGANVNAPAAAIGGRTAIQEAAGGSRGNIELFKLLLDSGADIHAPASREKGITALQGAAIRGHINIAQILLKEGVSVNEPPASINGRTALEGAAEHGRLDMVQLLLNAGADQNAPLRKRYLSAMRFAKKENHFAIFNLLQHRRDTEEKNMGDFQADNTPLDLDEEADEDMEPERDGYVDDECPTCGRHTIPLTR